MKWSQTTPLCNSVEEVVSRNTGLSIDEFLNPQWSNIAHLQDVADYLKNAAALKKSVTIYGDYDADGITASAILYMILYHLGITPQVLLPRRFTDGYGFALHRVADVEGDVLITIDNGITAVTPIQHAKDAGKEVVVIDHHLPLEDGSLPNADIIVDPHVYDIGGFKDMCAAGLAYRLAMLLVDREDILNRCLSLAAIGTVADVMPLVHDNRLIVQQGLECLFNNRTTTGVRTLMELLDIHVPTAHDLGFSIGPVINACGRLHDDGATNAFEGILFGKHSDVEWMIAQNATRKTMVADAMEQAVKMIEDECMFGQQLLFIATPKNGSVEPFHEGIVGIVAGRLAEKYRCPVFVTTENENGIMKGSGRSYKERVHLRELLDACSEHLLGFGGHAGAAGLSYEPNKMDALVDAMFAAIPDADLQTEDDVLEYDLEIDSEQVPDVMQELDRYAPYGHGNPLPIFRVRDIVATPNAGKTYRLMGADNSHLRVFTRWGNLLGFSLGRRYEESGSPHRLEAIGELSINRFGSNKPVIQLAMNDFQAMEAVPISPLAQKLKERLNLNALT